MAEHYLNASDISRLAGVHPCTVRQWRHRWNDFPRPVDIYGQMPVYTEASVWEWLIEHQKIVVKEEA